MESTAATKAIASAVAVTAVVAAFYFGAYFSLGSASFGNHFFLGQYRHFRWRWQAIIFIPAAKVESVARGFEIRTSFDSDTDKLGIELD